PGWYIILYHDVSWEETPFVRHIGGTCPPDVFQDHVLQCCSLGRIVSVQEGMERLLHNDIAGPLFRFWFDDGFVGVREYAAPILKDLGVTGATSICSNFLRRKEFFWRFKLSYLQSIDGGRHLRTCLRRYGYSFPGQVRSFTMDQFNLEILAVIDQLFNEATSLATREDSFRIFDTPSGLLELHRQGWIIANHSAAHYPIGEKHVQNVMMDQFEECDRWIKELIGHESEYWVFPFDRNIDSTSIDAIRKKTEKHIVQVREKLNSYHSFNSTRILFRINAPTNDRRMLNEKLYLSSRSAQF